MIEFNTRKGEAVNGMRHRPHLFNTLVKRTAISLNEGWVGHANMFADKIKM